MRKIIGFIINLIIDLLIGALIYYFCEKYQIFGENVSDKIVKIINWIGDKIVYVIDLIKGLISSL